MRPGRLPRGISRRCAVSASCRQRSSHDAMSSGDHDRPGSRTAMCRGPSIMLRNRAASSAVTPDPVSVTPPLTATNRLSKATATRSMDLMHLSRSSGNWAWSAMTARAVVTPPDPMTNRAHWGASASRPARGSVSLPGPSGWRSPSGSRPRWPAGTIAPVPNRVVNRPLTFGGHGRQNVICSLHRSGWFSAVIGMRGYPSQHGGISCATWRPSVSLISTKRMPLGRKT